MKSFLPSLLLLSVVRARPAAKDFVVKGLVDEEPAFAAFEGEMFAGVLPVDPIEEGDDDQLGHMMFWYFDSEEPRVDDTLIVWFNGESSFCFTSWRFSFLLHRLMRLVFGRDNL